MQGVVAVESNLSRLIDVLETEGYEVVELESETLDTVDAVVVSGADVNLMDMQDNLTDVPVINASGKSVEEILDALNKL